jgi:hypothetical protein
MTHEKLKPKCCQSVLLINTVVSNHVNSDHGPSELSDDFKYIVLSYRHGMCFRASSVFVLSIFCWFPQRTHYFWSVTLWQHFGLSLPNYDIILFNLFPFSPCVWIAHSWMPLDNVQAQGQGSGGITLNPCSKWLSPVKKNHFLLYNRLAYWNQTWWGCSLSIFLFGFLFVYLFVDFLM